MKLVPAAEALAGLEFTVGAAGGWAPLRFETEERRGLIWHAAGGPGSIGSLQRMVLNAEQRWSEEVTMGLPLVERWRREPTWATVLWARVEGGSQLARARAFRPLPAIALQEGSSTRRVLLWPLRERITATRAETMNKRIAYALGARQRDGRMDVTFPMPGTFLRVGRGRPTPVVCVRLEDGWWTAEQVAGRLKDPPPPHDWREGKR